MVETPQ